MKMISIDDFDCEKECQYHGETYSVRDNGAVKRHIQQGKKKRKLDNVWTFGKPSDKTGYMEIAGERVHRIVAFAFHGSPPNGEYVVDHIDTNRRNNRPENLQWVTKLENAINNPITRARIENICGSIEAFLENPSLLNGHENTDHNFHWMRTVSREEALISLKRMREWAKKPTKSKGGTLGDWIFQNPHKPNNDAIIYNRHIPQKTTEMFEENEADYSFTNVIEERELLETQSLTPNAIQLNWKYPVVFPCCPQQVTENQLKMYMNNLAEGKVFSKNDFGESTILDFGMNDSNNLWVMCSISIGWKSHGIIKITFKDGIFYHENMGVYDIGDEPEEIFESFLKGEYKEYN